MRSLFVVAISLLGVGGAMGEDKILQLENGAIVVCYDAAKGEFSLQAKPSGKTFVHAGRFATAGGEAKRTEVDHPALGKGQAIEVVRADGSRDAIMLFGDQPFAFFRATLHNAGKEATVTRNVRPCTFMVDLEKPASELKTLGTGGLVEPSANPGSYVWLAVADPKTRAGVVTGWVSNDRGSGVVIPKVDAEKVRLTAQIDYGRLRLEGGASESLETLAIGYFDDARLGLEGWADTVAKVYHIKLRPQPTGYCTWYSSPNGGAADEKSIVELSAFAAKQLAPYGFSVVQIDDGWQAGVSKNGPKRNFFTHATDGPYKSGMKKTADAIKALGLTPGIWFMPFAGTYYDPFFEKHRDWFVKRENGEPYETDWGGTCLDMTNPDARKYLAENIRRIGGEWGYQYFKMDGLWTGSGTKQVYVNDAYREDGIGDAVFQNPNKTNIEAYRDGLKLVREAAGNDIFILGCCVPQNMRSYGGAFGLVDAMRIGPDNGSDWSSLCTGPRYGSRNYFLHGRIWLNDPDPVYVRANIPLKHAELICSWAAISGQLNLSSEWLPGLPAERLDVLRRTMPSHGLLPRPVDLFESPTPQMWLLTDDRRSPRRDVIGLFNWASEPLEIDIPLSRIGLKTDGEYALFDYWANTFLPPAQGNLKITVPPQSCRILAAREAAAQPQVLSTSRHVTQGIIDVLDEKWDAPQNSLVGRSKLVGGDAYELRIAAMAKDKSWSVASAEVSAADKAAGVKIACKESGGLVRVVIESPEGREVAWTIRFQSGAKTATKPQAVAKLAASIDEDNRVQLAWNGADGLSFEIDRGDGVKEVAASSHYTDAKAEGGKTYRYQVTAVDWLGGRSETRSLEVKVPKAPELPPVPPKPDVSIMKLEPTAKSTGWGDIGQGKSAGGKPLTIGKDTFADGLGVHAVSELAFPRKPEYKRFVAVVGLDEGIRSNNRSSVVFKVIGDIHPGGTRVLAESPVLRFGKIERWHFDVELPADCVRVRLQAGDAGDGVNSDHADWCDAGFVVK